MMRVEASVLFSRPIEEVFSCSLSLNQSSARLAGGRPGAVLIDWNQMGRRPGCWRLNQEASGGFTQRRYHEQGGVSCALMYSRPKSSAWTERSVFDPSVVGHGEKGRLP